ncbi:hypothetical protein FOMPIDRAFT_1087017, partial [Fomitopsis schrenkii]
CANTKLTVEQIWSEEVKALVKKNTFQDWNAMASKYVHVAGGGSLYILMLIAVQNLRVPLGGVDGHT